MAHMNKEQKQVLRDALAQGKTIQYNRPNWTDYDPRDPQVVMPDWLWWIAKKLCRKTELEEALCNRELSWQVKPAPQTMSFSTKGLKELL